MKSLDQPQQAVQQAQEIDNIEKVNQFPEFDQ